MNVKQMRTTKTRIRLDATRVAEPSTAYGAAVPKVSLDHVDPRLHVRSGNLDALRIAQSLGIPPNRLASAVGYTPQGLSKNPSSDKLQPALAQIAYVIATLRELLGDDRSVSIWLRAPHPDLGGSTPLSFILSNKTGTVLTLLHLAESGQTS